MGKTKKSRLLAVLISFLLIYLNLPHGIFSGHGFLSAKAENSITVNLTIYSKNPNLQKLTMTIGGVGWFAEDFDYDLEDEDFGQPVSLANNLYRYDLALEIEDDFATNETVNLSLGSEFDKQRVTVKELNGTKQIDAIFKEHVFKACQFIFVDKQAQPLLFNTTKLNLALAEKSISMRKDAGSNTYNYSREKVYDENGAFTNQADLEIKPKQIIKADSKKYLLEQVEHINEVYKLTLSEIVEVEREVKLVFNLAFPYKISANDDITFILPDDSTYSTKLTAFQGSGDASYSFKLQTLAKGDIKLSKLPTSLDSYFGIIKQEFDQETGVLNVTLGKRIGIAVSPVKGNKNYNDFGTSHALTGVKLQLLDANQKTILESQVRAVYAGVYVNDIFVNKAGTYYIKVLEVAGQNDKLDLSRLHKLELKTNGRPYLEIYQESGYALANPYGAKDGVQASDEQSSINLLGSKTSYLLLLSHKPTYKKFLVLADGTEVKEQTGKANDVVSFKLRMTIPSDHNYVLRYDKYVNIGSKTDLSFQDILDKRLEFIADSLALTVDGQSTNDYKVSYDAAKHAIMLQDQSAPDVINFDFTKEINLPKAKQLEITFKAKINLQQMQTKGDIVNILGDDKVTIKLERELEVKKLWQQSDGHDLTENLVPIKVVLYRDQQATDKTYELNATNNWQIKISHLPRYATDGHEIEYSVQEENDNNGKVKIGTHTFGITYEQAGDVCTLTNKLEPPTPTEPTPSEPPTPTNPTPTVPPTPSEPPTPTEPPLYPPVPPLEPPTPNKLIVAKTGELSHLSEYTLLGFLAMLALLAKHKHK